MTDQVRVGVAGTSWFAQTLHLASLESHPSAEVVAICGRDRERAGQVAAEHGIPQVFTDYRQMITSGRLDALVVVTPDATHFPITMSALEAGLHVMCEKPMALTADHARQMHDAAEAAGLVTMVGFTWRWVPAFSYLHHLIAQGYLGRCHQADFRYQHGGAFEPAYTWQLDPDLGNGILGNLGSHMIDLARWYVGDIARVSGSLKSLVARHGPDGERAFAAANDSALVTVEFAEGAHGTISVSGVTRVGERGQDFQVRLYGDAGSLELDFCFAGSRLRGVQQGDEGWRDLVVPPEFRGEGANPPLWVFDFFAPFTNQPVGDRLFIDAITGRGTAEPTFYDGWKTQQVVDAAVASHREGRWITIS
jgi:predicted dehydrogenase